MRKKAIIIGAGPGGLTAAYELLQRTDILPVILEKSEDIGGISKTINYKGNRMDMGPHRFFSKSDRVMDWWLKIMPLRHETGGDVTINYQNKSRTVDTMGQQGGESGQENQEKVMLVIKRLTRIYFLRKFFAYPVQLTLDTLRTLGLARTIKILLSFLWIRLFPRKPEANLEDFIVNKFGRELYLLFFKDYTEKVWGVPCNEISAEWGAQRIKGVSLGKAIGQALKSISKKRRTDIRQKEKETSLIEQFLYPKYGPGSLWEEVARQVQEMGGKIYRNQDVTKIRQENHSITTVETVNSATGQRDEWEGDYFFSTMPISELIGGMDGVVPADVQEIAAGLQYRDFINVGVLLRQLSATGKDGNAERLNLKDNWIYIQERDAKVGRIMIYNNWGDGMIKDPGTTWIGMEYFCNKTDDFWALDDSAIRKHAIDELEKMGLAKVEDVLDATVKRMEKTYPAYFGTYHRFDQVRQFTDKFANLFLVGRNGMHKYNNADHSMLTAMVAVDNIIAGLNTKANIWAINTEQEYHEERQPCKLPKTDSAQALPPISAKKSVLNVPGSFTQFIWGDASNRMYLTLSFAIFLIQFIIFKLHYPFANYMPDSYSYIEAAYSNADVNTWPVAYSKFLRLFSVFSHSDKLLVGFQYLVLEISTMLFLFSLLYLIRPGKMVKNVLYIFIVICPVQLYISNYISADAIFISLSLCWVSSLLWIIYRPANWLTFIQAILLLACFTFRYNAIYYPLISFIGFILSSQTSKRKIIGISFGFLLILFSVLYTSETMQAETGKMQFSAFGGWQLANNALYMYQNLKPAERGPAPAKYHKLDSMVRAHMDTIQKVKFTNEDSAFSFFYLWSPKGPLIQYLYADTKRDTRKNYFQRWASEGPLYGSYGLFLIKTHPLLFGKTFLLNNMVKYVLPPPEFLGMYNMGSDSVKRLAKEWFHYKTQQIQSKAEMKKKISVGFWLSLLNCLVNVILAISICGLPFFGGREIIKSQTFNVAALLSVFISTNFLFSTFASPIVLRYQIFPFIVSLSLAVLLIEYIINQDKTATRQRVSHL